MTKIFDTRQLAVLRAGLAGPTAPGERTPSCGGGSGAPRRQQVTRGDQQQRADALSRVARPHTVCHLGFLAYPPGKVHIPSPFVVTS
jgi:hypothetical protein